MIKEIVISIIAFFVIVIALSWPASCMQARALRALTGNDKITCSVVFWSGDSLRVNNLLQVISTPTPEESAPFTDED